MYEHLAVYGILSGIIAYLLRERNRSYTRFSDDLGKLSSRAMMLGGLNPAVVDPDTFGPDAMAEAHLKVEPIRRDDQPPGFDDEDQAVEAQNQRWEKEAQELEEAVKAGKVGRERMHQEHQDRLKEEMPF